MELRTIRQEELAEIIVKHRRWSNDEEGGERANLNGANLNGANLECANLECANLNHANLEGASLDHARLNHANLEGASLEGASLDHASLYYASLDHANLNHANLNGANLNDASLDHANLEGASLDHASLEGASLNDAKGKVLSIGPIGSRNGITYAHWSDRDKSIHIQCGCFYGIFDDWVNKCAETHGDSVHGKAYAAAAEFIKTFAEINNWEEEEKE